MKQKKLCKVTYDDIISLENLLLAWHEFRLGKKYKKDVQIFEYRLMENLLGLYAELKEKIYTHGTYTAFKINDPKPRDIHKAFVRDRVLHHALYRRLSPHFFKVFIHDSYSCQIGKGTHKALKRFELFHRKVSNNNTKQCYVLKCDIRKFFASIDQTILMSILEKHIEDENILWLFQRVVQGFVSGQFRKGLPLGNLTSQLLVNIYMHEFDRYIKHELKVRYYIRYADDFVVLSQDKKYLEDVLGLMRQFLGEKLSLQTHPRKISIETITSGVDFLGFVHFPKHKVLRTVSKKRMYRKLSHKNIESYKGMLRHGNTYELLKTLNSSIAIVRKDA